VIIRPNKKLAGSTELGKRSPRKQGREGRNALKEKGINVNLIMQRCHYEIENRGLEDKFLPAKCIKGKKGGHGSVSEIQ